MNSTALILWHSFLQSTPSDQRKSLLNCISPKLLVDLQAQPLPSKEPFQELDLVENQLSQIHYSWFAPFLRSLPENEIKLFLTALTPVQIQGLKQSLLLSNTLPVPSSVGKNYLEKMLFETVASEDLVPLSCLPDDPLNILLNLTFPELLSLIDLSSMHDLSIEIRHIIETSKLKEIYALLTKAQITFLKTLLHRKEAVSFKRMELIRWKGDREALRYLLLQRGINRIAKSLHGHHPSLLWHIAHRLDTEKGQLLIKLCSSLDHPQAANLLAEQVVELVNILKMNHNPSENL